MVLLKNLIIILISVNLNNGQNAKKFIYATGKKTIYFLILIHLLSCKDNYKENPHILLKKDWKFKTGDSLRYSKPDFDDSTWQSININNSWENQGHIYDGYAWYRTTVFIPSSIQKVSYFKDSVKIHLGKIDEFDQVYLNGFIIGQNTKSLPYKSIPDTSLNDTLIFSKKARTYTLPINDKRILWDKNNVIAVRVFDPFNSGGLYSGTPYLGISDLEDYIIFDKERFYKLNVDSVDDIEFDTSLIIKNISPKIALDGRLSILAKSIQTKREVFNKDLRIKLEPGNTKSIPVSLPITTDPLKIYFTYRDYDLKIKVEVIDTIPYVLVKKSGVIKN